MFARSVLFATLLPSVFADIQFTNPAAGTTLAAGKPITARWKDSGDGTALTDLKTYTLFLCAGGNDADSFVSAIPAHRAFKRGTRAADANGHWEMLDRTSSDKRKWAVQYRQ